MRGRLARELAALQQRYNALQGAPSRREGSPNPAPPIQQPRQETTAEQAPYVDESRGEDLEAEYLSR